MASSIPRLRMILVVVLAILSLLALYLWLTPSPKMVATGSRQHPYNIHHSAKMQPEMVPPLGQSFRYSPKVRGGKESEFGDNLVFQPKEPLTITSRKPGLLFEIDKSGFNLTKLLPLPGEKTSERWVVVTTIQKPTEDMHLLGQMSRYGWRVLAVGDKSTPDDWVAPEGVRFLSHSEASALPYNLMKYHLWKVYPAKNVGYMFAIHHGAKLIYDTDDDNHPTDELRSMLTLAGVAFDGAKGSVPAELIQALYWAPESNLSMPVINPLPHFGQSLLWPRGYPLREIAKDPLRIYKFCSTRPPAWIQGVVNGDPDMDAIFRLTRKHHSTPINMTFDGAPPVVAPQGFYVQSNSQNTLMVASAIPYLMLPYTMTMRETDIWRAYVANRMLWLSGDRKAYVSPNAFQARNPHDYLKDFKDEMQLYVAVERLITFLQSWHCSENLDAAECFELLYRHLATQGLVGERDAYTAAAWVTDLKRIGFQYPSRGEREDCDNSHQPQATALVFPVEQRTTIPSHRQLADAFESDETWKPLLQACLKVNVTSTSPLSCPRRLSDVTLLFTCSSANVQELSSMVTRLGLLYKPFVSRIMICLSSASSSSLLSDPLLMEAANKSSISFVAPSNDCLNSAKDMRLFGSVFVSVSLDAKSLVTPKGLVDASRLEGAAVACDEAKSVVVVTASHLATQASDTSPTSLCNNSRPLVTTKCSSSPLSISHSSLSASSVNQQQHSYQVVNECPSPIGSIASLATQCRHFAVDQLW